MRAGGLTNSPAGSGPFHRALVVAAALVAVASSCTSQAGPIDAGPDGVVRVALWGDSLAHEAATYFVDAFVDQPMQVEVGTGALGGVALCDSVEPFIAKTAEVEYDAIVLAYSGNAFTPCMRDDIGDPLRGTAHTARYQQALERIEATARERGIALFIAGAPMAQTASPEATSLIEMYRRFADRSDVTTFVDVDDALLEDGRWTATLPCLPIEGPEQGCVDGRIAVHAPDGAHFCPTAEPAVLGVINECDAWSSGAYRYAQALADPVIARLARP
ncbi:MAG: hypothetical protein HKN26_07265 [Acidimicrobiales bacterium]|nr:hypothetical protein [Acidimicrobiales bacterium]